jgi:DNA mismatch endonuclease (patch repair protein)
MSRIRGKDTKPEIQVRRFLHAAGLRYRLHVVDLPGKPDLVFPSRRIALFVHGCFWHRHDDPTCLLARMPKSKLDFWGPKLRANVERDNRNATALVAADWRVLIGWECAIGRAGGLDTILSEIRAAPRYHRR